MLLVVGSGRRQTIPLDHRFGLRPLVPCRNLDLHVPHGPVPPQPLFEHPREHRNVSIDVVEDADFQTNDLGS